MEEMVKTFKLLIHQRTFSEADLLINSKNCPETKIDDIVEIYHPDEDNDKEYPRLLLQIKSFSEDLQAKDDTISIEQSICTSFGLKTYKNVLFRLVDPAKVALDSIELTFRDQYMGRSEMWRLKNSMVNTCVYTNKKLEFCGGAGRCHVHEMWAQGERVACGVIAEDTKVVFRSSTSMVYLFLQMSSEMWDFDIYGDLYFEKAVNGFLNDLFMKWKKNGSNHEVTIVLFSRTFYEAGSLEEFPEYMRECLQKDYKGRYYEDFYRVAVQNERYDDWTPILVQLRKIFSSYLDFVLEYHARPDQAIPQAFNSTAAQGNFLEVLNMSLNVFEKHYLDRSFDRTGQLSVVVTPGVGVFEVDRELTNITKQRIIDNGVGSDLVCVGEQPLHAVPLLKFHNKDTHLNVPDDYSMPHWINLSFYSTNKKIAYSNFIPRIKLPPMLSDEKVKKGSMKNNKLVAENECIHNSFFDYDAYDAQIFQVPSVHHHESTLLNRTFTRNKRSSGSLLDSQEANSGRRRKLSDPDIQHRVNTNARSEPIAIPPAAISPVISPHIEERESSSPPVRMVVGSAGSPPLESKALINPFDPSHVTIKLTSNRRRWTHIFPKGPTGVLIQQHHYQAIPAQQQDQDQSGDGNIETGNSQGFCVTAALHQYCKKRPTQNMGPTVGAPKNMSKSALLWGATGEQEWTPALTTGVDWKSLTIPACLPITTDYFPDKRALNIDYVVSLYTLLPESVIAEIVQQRQGQRCPLTTLEVYRELISQRLAQGFQLILLGERKGHDTGAKGLGMVLGHGADEQDECYYLSIGRLFHKIQLSGNTILVTRYRPRHPYPGFNYQYRYRFFAPYHDTYEESYATFTTEKLEHYNWNYLDHYVCTGGDSEFYLVDALKYWRFRVFLIPLNNSATKKIIDGAPHYDIYPLTTVTDHHQMTDGLLKFIETAVNKLRRVGVSKKPRMSLNILNSAPPIQPRRNSMSNFMQSLNNCSSPFRERLGSNRLPDRPRPRSGSKVMEKNKPSTLDSQSVASSELTSEVNSEDTVGAVMLILLKAKASNAEVVEAMKHSPTGLSFISHGMHQELPQYTFITAEAVNWLVMYMEGIANIDQAMEVMKGLHKAELICHASGDKKRPFVYGFCLFYILPNESDEQENAPSGDLQGFENEFLEIEVRPALNWGFPAHENVDKENCIPHFLYDEVNPDYLEYDVRGAMYKRMRLETDINNKSERTEWGHTKYQTVFRPDQSFELVVEWLTSSGSIINELLLGWARKAQTCGLQMIPIPHDPLALPYSNKSDPLRGPIFVPLNIACLEDGDHLFKEFKDNGADRLFLFQEAIVARFGFLPCLVETQNKSASREHQYIHSTGTVFVLVSSVLTRPRSRVSSFNKSSSLARYSVYADVMASPHEAYITRHVSGKNKQGYDNSRKMGFLWCWNHMISKRWRTNQAVDTNFQTRFLKDFKEFCANSDNRLRTYWEECWKAKEERCVGTTR